MEDLDMVESKINDVPPGLRRIRSHSVLVRSSCNFYLLELCHPGDSTLSLGVKRKRIMKLFQT
eukprot:6491909-Amphidinium_carterae.2